MDCPMDKEQMTIEELNVLSKGSVKSEDFSEGTSKGGHESHKKIVDIDEIQSVD